MCDDFDSGFDCGDFDCDSGCDIDNDADCDCSHHTDCLDDSLWENHIYMADYMQWNTLPSNRNKGPRKITKSAIRKLRRKAFIWNRKKVKVGYKTGDLLNKHMETVYVLLHNQAFKHINLVPEKTIGPHSLQKVGSVKAIEIDGCTDFRAKDRFSYDANVTIYYRAKKEIQIPFSARSVRRRNYKEICEELTVLGFSTIQQNPKRNIVTGWLKTEGAIDKIYINGDSSFKEGYIYPFDAKIIIEYDSRIFK